MSRFGKVVRVVLFIQVALFVFKGLAYWLGLPNIPGVIGAGAMSRRVAVLDWGFGVLLFLAGRRLSQDPRWIHPVLAMVLFNWLESCFEILVIGDSMFIPPLIFESALGALYATYSIFLLKAPLKGQVGS